MKRALQLLLLLLLSAQACAGPHTLVLVVRADSKVTDLDSLTVRKLFLGLPVLVEGSPLRPIRNRTDADLDPVFLQQIVAMSQSAYDRQILIGVNRQGWLRPVEVTSTARMLEMLYADPNAITFIWLSDVQRDSRLRVIRQLWSD
jgi:hypothetical protein